MDYKALSATDRYTIAQQQLHGLEQQYYASTLPQPGPLPEQQVTVNAERQAELEKAITALQAEVETEKAASAAEQA